MRYLSAAEAKQGVAEKRDVADSLSESEEKRLKQLNVLELKRFCDMVGDRTASGGLTDKKLATLLLDE